MARVTNGRSRRLTTRFGCRAWSRAKMINGHLNTRQPPGTHSRCFNPDVASADDPR